jgi:hypothetical protein
MAFVGLSQQHHYRFQDVKKSDFGKASILCRLLDPPSVNGRFSLGLWLMNRVRRPEDRYWWRPVCNALVEAKLCCADGEPHGW